MPSPRFTIVLPVRNGGEYVKQCVASILAQTLADDFELLILDNASTDGTAAWLATLRDPRVRLHPAESALSIEENWARIKELPTHEFLTTIGHDDLLDPEFLAVVSRLIDAEPQASLYLTHFRHIDNDGAVMKSCRPMPARETAAEFLASRLAELRDSYGTGYVVRSALYREVGGIPPFRRLLYADDALWLRVMTRGGGHRATSPQECFSYRYHAGSAARTTAMAEYLTALEAYWDELETLARQDAEIGRVLARYGSWYLSLFGRGCRRTLLEGRILRGEAADPALDARLEQLLDRGGVRLQDLRQGSGARALALVERAARTRLGRLAYRLSAAARDALGRGRDRPGRNSAG